ncbi:hypothetical protein [Legionella sp. WA2022007384]
MQAFKISKIKKVMFLITQVMILNLLVIKGAYAYFDYGTGSLLIQSLVAFFGVVAMFFNRIKELVLAFFRKLFSKKQPAPKKEIENS